MKFRDKIINLFSKEEVQATVKTVPTNTKTKTVFEFANKQNYRITSTTKKWRDSLSYAEDWENPNRAELLRVYKEAVLDSTIRNSMDIRIQRILSAPFNIVNSDNSIAEDAENIFRSNWFEKYLSYVMESIFYGHSLIQIDAIENGTVKDVSLIPRENVIPEFALFKKAEYDMKESAIDYTTPKVYKWLCEAYKDRRDIGLLNSVVQYHISRKIANQAWTQFVEKFGEPIIIGRTNSNLESEKNDLKDFLSGLSLSSSAVLDKQTDIEFKETSRADAYSVYKELINSTRDDINTVILGGTELTSGGQGGSEARATVHSEQSNYKTKADIRFILNNVNNVLIPKLKELGLINKDIKFEFASDDNITPSEKIKIDKELMNAGYKLSDEYISKIYEVELVKPKETESNGTNV